MVIECFARCEDQTRDPSPYQADAHPIELPHPALLFCLIQNHEPGHEKMCLMLYANNKGLDSIIFLDPIAEISRL